MNSNESKNSFRVVVYPKAHKSLLALPKHIQVMIKNSLRLLEAGGDLPRVKPLTGNWFGCFSWRFGVYRVIFEIDQAEKVFIVIRVGHRSKVYD
jgi:mRNA interferase RelE/StbE